MYTGIYREREIGLVVESLCPIEGPKAGSNPEPPDWDHVCGD